MEVFHLLVLPQDVRVAAERGFELQVALQAQILLARLPLVVRLVFVLLVPSQLVLGERHVVAQRALDGAHFRRQMLAHMVQQVFLLVRSIAAQVAEEVFDLFVHDVDVTLQVNLPLSADRANSAKKTKIK